MARQIIVNKDENDLYDANITDSDTAALSSLGAYGSRDKLTSPKLQNNTLPLSGGNFTINKVDKKNTDYKGLGNTASRKNLSIQADSRYFGMTFAETITITAGTTAIFTNCFFEKAAINIAAGAFVHFIGVVLDENTTYSHTGAAANVYAIGVSNKTGAVLANTTIVAETT